MKNNYMLIVDDQAISRDILRSIFEDDFEIMEVSNGEEMLKIIENSNVDIVLLDLVMPGISGLDILKIRQKSAQMSKVPFVVITSSDDVDDQILAFSLGADDYVTKPFIPELVRLRVNNVLLSKKRYDSIVGETELLRKQNTMDDLSGLYNKAAVEKLVENALLERPGGLHAMMVIDIDNFKYVNDKEGHLVGDHTIRIISKQISSQFRQSDIVGRVGGDEFVVFMGNLPSKEIARRKANELVLQLRSKPNVTLPANVSVSVGLAFSDRKECSYKELFKMADDALNSAKNAGKARSQEHGLIEETNAEDKKTVVVFSRNRRVVSQISAVIYQQYRIVGCANKEAFDQLCGEQEIVLVFMDLSAEMDDGKVLAKVLADGKEKKKVPMIAICAEGYMKQYQQALSLGAKDIITVPLDASMLKRRVLALLNIKE